MKKRGQSSKKQEKGNAHSAKKDGLKNFSKFIKNTKSERKFGSDKHKKKNAGSEDAFETKKQFKKPGKKFPVRKAVSAKVNIKAENSELIRLNKYLSNAGIASRREADTLIESGAVRVNGQIVTQLGFKIKPGDTVTYGDEPVKTERKVYLLLNKPKDFITTTNDPRERRTVMELVKSACRERIYPIGRLDRNTTGLLLFTNDGELATKLMHPKSQVRKLYHVVLDKAMKPEDYEQLCDGVELEDGFIKPDDIAFTGNGRKELGIEIHSGRNRIIRRMFEHLGYTVIKLDRVAFAGLTKKDLPRGKYRFLSEKEIAFLKMLK